MTTSAVDLAERGILEHADFEEILSNTSQENEKTCKSSPSEGLDDKLSLINAQETSKLPLPLKAHHEARRWTRFQLWFNTYRKFFVVAVTFNAIGLLLAGIGVWQYPRHHTSAFILGNFMVTLLVRNELFGRFLYLTVNTLFAKWTPLPFRLACTSVLQHLGGIHSGCAVSGLMWLTCRVVHDLIEHETMHDAILVMGVFVNLAIAITIASALPWVRNTHHNVFERSHRFSGWLALIFTWAFVVMSDNYDVDTRLWSPSGSHLVKQQDFWFTCVMTFLIVWPWLTIRKVKVEVEIPSPKVVVLKFQRGIQQGLLTRISRTAILSSEYHTFGIISEGVHAEHHYLICGVQGDFTKKLLEDSPSHLWTRQLKFAGVSNTSTLYKRGIRVCTGTGLGSALSTCLQSPDWYLIWIGSDQEKTLGPTISGLIHDNLEGRVTIWDSKERGGRPDTMKLIKEAYAFWNAEVVFITSNWVGNKGMMEGCKEAGIPAIGTLWDF